MATEPFALHNLGNDTVLIIRDTRCCHATMVNAKGPFTSVMPQKAGAAYGEPNPSRTPLGPHYFLNKWEKSICPFFPLQKRVNWDFRKQRRAQLVIRSYTVTAPGLQPLPCGTSWPITVALLRTGLGPCHCPNTEHSHQQNTSLQLLGTTSRHKATRPTNILWGQCIQQFAMIFLTLSIQIFLN